MDIRFDEISKKLFQYCMKGELHLIVQLLRPFSFRQRMTIVNRPNVIESFNLKETIKSETTCLLVACLKNNLEIVRYLIDNCGASLETLTSSRDFEDWDCLTFFVNRSKRYNEILMPNFNYTATVLWHACRSSDIKIIKFLIQRNATVNSTTETSLNSTPLMVACCKSRVEEIKFLLKEGKANVNQVDMNGEHCLFYAVRCNQNCINILELLIAKGAEVNKKNSAGKTVLELAADLELTAAMEYLIQSGARIFKHDDNISMLTKAAITGHITMYSLLFECADITLEEKINSLEIVGITSAYGSIKSCKLPSYHNIPYSIMYWECSLDLRASNLSLPAKKIRKLNSFLDEFKNYDDLNKIQLDIIEFKMQSLWIIDRMLTEYPSIKDYYTLTDFNFYDFFEMNNKLSDTYMPALDRSTYRGNYIRNFKRLCKLWIFGLGIQIEYLETMHNSILRNIIGLICFIKISQEAGTFKASTGKFIEENIILGEILIKLLKVCIFELTNAGIMSPSSSGDINYEDLFENRLSPTQKPTKRVVGENYTSNSDFLLRITVYIIRLISRLNQDSMLSQTHMIQMRYLISLIVAKKLNSTNLNTTLYGLSVKNNLLKRLPIDSDFSFDDYVSTDAIKLMLECGADPNMVASTRCPKKTFLNSAVFSKDLKNKIQSDELILLFLKFGAHLDFTTAQNQTLVDKYKAKYTVNIHHLINPIKHTSLQCLAAKAINSHGLNYENILSKNLCEFVQRH
jgi:ankyrin repeat protein